MPAPQRQNLLASRRRRQDDGEEEESVIGEFEDDSLSEGSAVSNVDEGAGDEASDSSDDEREAALDVPEPTKGVPPKPNGAFTPAVDADAVLHGLDQVAKSQETEESHFHEVAGSGGDAMPKAEAAVPKASRHETPLQRSRREHQEYIRQRNANPAFVPTRGGFFLHDDRNSLTNVPNARAFMRGRGRGHGPPVYAGYV
jgi:next-to-BRCA1 protein 1